MTSWDTEVESQSDHTTQQFNPGDVVTFAEDGTLTLAS